MKTVTASEDWLSYALAEYDEEKLAAAGRRAEAALKVRLDSRVSRFLKRAESLEELGERLDAVDESVQETVTEIAAEYNADPTKLYEAAVRKIADYFNAPFQEGQQGTPPHGYTEVQCAKCGSKAGLGTPCPMCGHINEAGEAPGSQPQGGGGMGGLRERIMGKVAADDYSQPYGSWDNPATFADSDLDVVGKECPTCGGPLMELGRMGRLTHYRCRNCGAEAHENEQGHAFYDDGISEDEEPSGMPFRAKQAAGPEMPDGAHYDYERVNPKTPIGGDKSVAQAEGPGYEYNRDVEDALGQSKDHPREHQDIKQYVEDRRTMNDTPDKDVVKREVKHIDADSPIGAEQKGVGGTFPRGNQAPALAAVTSKFHILD